MNCLFKTISTVDILAFGAHPDDIELGMGASIAKFVAEGLRVGLCDLTDGEPTPLGSHSLRLSESVEAAQQLKVAFRVNLGQPNRILQDSVDKRFQIADLLRQTEPSLIFAPYWEDAHPDHKAACSLLEAARFYAKLTKTHLQSQPISPPRMLHYFCNHYRLQEPANLVLDTTGFQDQKLAAIKSYHSQFNETRGNLDSIQQKILHLDGYWGSKIGTVTGEAFTSREIIGFSSLKHLCY